MGVVYLAERADGAYEQRVALKLLPPALQTELFARRFVLERQILARLEHAGIARLLDGGVGEHGEPYFVLEFIDGEPLTRWCDQRRLDIGDRLRLFLRVCDAVQYAHGRLGRVEEAEPLARGAVAVLSASLPDGHEHRTEAEATLAAIRQRLAAVGRVDAE